ncbi:hypothetical protein P3T23_004954 [Paraburkholderia sp. GAS448]
MYRTSGMSIHTVRSAPSMSKLPSNAFSVPVRSSDWTNGLGKWEMGPDQPVLTALLSARCTR